MQNKFENDLEVRLSGQNGRARHHEKHHIKEN